jgi:hypothetical protein
MQIGYMVDVRELANAGELATAVINASDITSSAAADVTLTLFPLAAGDIIRDVNVLLVTTVTGPTGTPTIAVGVTGATTQFVAASSIVASAPVSYIPTAVSGLVYTSASAISVIATINKAAGNGAAATAGKIIVTARIQRARNISNSN